MLGVPLVALNYDFTMIIRGIPMIYFLITYGFEFCYGITMLTYGNTMSDTIDFHSIFIGHV